MLSDSQCQLLTAYVDDELDARERSAVERLVTVSAEARDFLDQLQADSKELRQLPTRSAPTTLADAIMETVHDSNPHHQAVPAELLQDLPAAPLQAPLPGHRLVPRWLGLAVAACVLTAVGLGTFMFFGLLLRNNPPDPLVDGIFAGAATNFGEPVADKDAGVRLVMAEMNDEVAKSRLANALSTQPAFWFDVPATSAKGPIDKGTIDHWTTAFKKTGITVLEDATARKSLAAKQSGVQYVLYAENLSRADITSILQTVASSNQLSTQPTKPFDRLLMRDMVIGDRESLAKLMHVKADLLDPANGGGPDLKMLIPAPTDEGPKKAPLIKAPQRLALLLPFNSSADLGKSNELGQFRATQGLRPGTLQMVVLIREQAPPTPSAP